MYEPYCANYSHAVDIMMSVEQNLMVCLRSHASVVSVVEPNPRFTLDFATVRTRTRRSDRPNAAVLLSGICPFVLTLQFFNPSISDVINHSTGGNFYQREI